MMTSLVLFSRAMEGAEYVVPKRWVALWIAPGRTSTSNSSNQATTWRICIVPGRQRLKILLRYNNNRTWCATHPIVDVFCWHKFFLFVAIIIIMYESEKKEFSLGISGAHWSTIMPAVFQTLLFILLILFFGSPYCAGSHKVLAQIQPLSPGKFCCVFFSPRNSLRRFHIFILNIFPPLRTIQPIFFFHTVGLCFSVENWVSHTTPRSRHFQIIDISSCATQISHWE